MLQFRYTYVEKRLLHTIWGTSWTFSSRSIAKPSPRVSTPSLKQTTNTSVESSERLSGEAGDYLVRSGKSQWPVDREIFEASYRLIEE